MEELYLKIQTPPKTKKINGKSSFLTQSFIPFFNITTLSVLDYVLTKRKKLSLLNYVCVHFLLQMELYHTFCKTSNINIYI